MANEVIQDQVRIQLDLVLDGVDDRKFKAKLIEAANELSTLISQAKVNSDLEVDLQLDEGKLRTDLKGAADKIRARLDEFQGSFKNADTTEFKQAFSKVFQQLGTALSAATKEYSVEVTQAYDKLAAQNKRELNRLGQREFEGVQRYASQKRLQNKLLTEVLKSSASINNSLQVSKDKIPLPPILIDGLERALKEEDARLQKFEAFTKDRNVEALKKAREAGRYRRSTIRESMSGLDTAQKDFNFSSVERALRREISDLTTLQDQAELTRKDAIGRAIQRRDSQLRSVQEKRRGVFGSTLGTSIEQAEYRSATAESRYKTARDRAKRPDLPVTERIAAETVAQRELNTARDQAYRVLEKLAPLEKSNAEDDQKAFKAANERVAALAEEVGVLKDLKDARIRASQQSDASTSLTTQLGKVDPLLQELSGLRKGSEDYRVVEARLRRALTKAGRAANKLDDDARFAELDQKKARVAGVLGDAGLWQTQAGRNQLQDATRMAIQSARQKQSRAQVYTDDGRIQAHNESVLAGLKRVKDDGYYTGPEKDIGAVVLSGIARQHDGEKGRSSEVLKAITEWADRNNERIVLNAKATGDLQQEELVKWYERNGFVTRRDGAMERTPRPLSAADLKRIKVEELGSEVGRDLRIITKGTAKPAALDKAARILRLNMGKLRTEAAKQGGEILREFMDLETEVKQALDTLSTKDMRKELAARLREYRAARGVMWATEPGSPEYGKARLQTLKASQAASNTSQSTGVGTGIAERLAMRLRGGELLTRFSALQTGALPTNEKDLTRFLNKVKDIRREVDKLDKDAAKVGFERASASAKDLINYLDDLRKDARGSVRAAQSAETPEQYLERVRRTSEKWERRANKKARQASIEGFDPLLAAVRDAAPGTLDRSVAIQKARKDLGFALSDAYVARREAPNEDVFKLADKRVTDLLVSQKNLEGVVESERNLAKARSDSKKQTDAEAKASVALVKSRSEYGEKKAELARLVPGSTEFILAKGRADTRVKNFRKAAKTLAMETDAQDELADDLKRFVDSLTRGKEREEQNAAKLQQRADLAANIRKYRAERAIIRSAEFGSPEYKNALRKSNTAARAVQSLREQNPDIGTIVPSRLLDDRTVAMARARASAKGNSDYLKGVRAESDRMEQQRTKDLLQRFREGNKLDADLRAKRNKDYLASVKDESQRMEEEAAASAATANQANLRSQFLNLGYRKKEISETLKSMVASDPLGVDGAIAKLQILKSKLQDVAKTSSVESVREEFKGLANAVGKAVRQVERFDKRPPAEDFNAHVGVYQTRKTRIEAVGRVGEALSSRVSDIRTRLGTAQTEGDIKALRIELADVLTDVRALNTASKKLDFQEGIDSARQLRKEISDIGDTSKGVLKEIKGPTAAEVRRAEKERIRQALIAEGQLAFEEVGGYKNYAQIPKEQYKPALEAARDREASILNRFATVRDDKTLDPGIKKKQLRELTVEFNQASRAAKVLQQEINGNVGFLRQLSLAARNFARYFLFYGGMYQIIGYFTQMTRTVVQFQDALKQTQVIAQATTREMGGIGEAVRSVAAESGNSLQEVATAAETLAQAGTSVKDIPAALKAVSDFAMATGSSLQVAADIITSAKEIFGENLTFAGAADQLTRAVNISKLRAEDLRTIFNLGAQTAQASGLSSAQFLGASATLSNLGIKSSTVATGLRQLLLELFNPDEKTIAFLRKRYNELGERLSDGDIRSRFQGFQSSNNPLLAALGELRRIGAAGSGRDEFRRVLDIRAENVALPLLQRLDELSKNVTQISATGAASAGAADRVQTLLKALQQLGVKFQLLAEQLAGDLPKDLENLAKSIGGFIDRLRGYDLSMAAKGESSSIDKGTTLAGGVIGYLAARTRLGRLGSAAAGAVTGAATYLGSKAAEGGDAATGEKVTTAVQGLASAWAAFAVVKKVFGKLREVFVKVKPAAAAAESGMAGISLAVEETVASAGVLGRLGALFARFNPFLAVAAWAYTAYELFSTLRDAFGKQESDSKDPAKLAEALTSQQEAVSKVLAEQQQAVGQAEQALEQISEKSRDSIQSQAKVVEEQVGAYNTLLKDIFGKNADDAAKMLEELGSVPLEVGTKRTKEMRARLEAKAPKGIDEQKFMALSKARADFTAAQGSLTALAEQQLNKAAQIVREGQANMDESEKAFLVAVEELRDSPLFKPGAFSPENMVQSLKDLYRLMQFDIDQKTKQLKDAQAAVGNTQAQQTSMDLRQAYGESSTPDTRKQFDIFIQQARQNPTQEGLAQLQRIKAETAKYLQEQIAAAPKDAPIPQDMADRITNLEDVQKKVDEAIKVSSDALSTAEERKKKADADAAEQKKIDEAKAKARAAEEEAAAISAEQVEVAKKALEVDKDEYDAKVKLAQKEGRWEELLKPGGLIDQQYAARVKVAEMEQQLAAQELRKAADAAGLTLPKGFTELKDPKDRVAVKRVEGGPDKLSKLDQANVSLASIKKTRDEVKASMLEASKQVIPFTESEAYNRRQIEIRQLKEKINDSEKEGLSEMLGMVDKLYELEIANIQEEIDHIKSQKDNYGSSEKEQAKYRIDLAKAEDKKAEAVSQLRQQRQSIIDKSERQALDAEKKSIEAQQKLIREQNKRLAQAPETTRRGVQVLTGVPPQMGGVSSGGISPNAQTAYDYFIRKGLKPYQAAGIVGNLMHESYARLDPKVTNSRGAVGIAQWLYPSRKAALLSEPKPYELQTQLDFIWKEYNSTMGGAKKSMLSSKDLPGAVDSFLWDFENPGKSEANRDKRLRNAQQVLAAMQGSGAAYGYRSMPGSAPVSRMRSWDEFPFIDQNGTGGSDVIGLEKFKNMAPEVYQAVIGGAMKWVEEQGGKSKVMIRDLGRHGGRGNHKFGFAGDVQLVDKKGKVLPNIMAGGETFRNYERFWQDGVAYAMGQKPEWANLPDYFRYGGYFLDNTPVDIMHGDITKKYNPGTPMPAGGTLAGGANRKLLSKFSNLGIISQGIPGGDWNAYRQARFGAGTAPTSAPDNTNQYLNVLSGLNFGGTDTANVIENNSRQLQSLDLQWIENARKRSLKDPNVDLKAEVDTLVAKTYEDVTKSQQRKVDSLRSGLEAQQSYVTLKQTEMLPLGPEVAAARAAAGLSMAPTDELTRLRTVKDELDKVSLASEKAWYASEEMRQKLTEQKGLTEDTLAGLNDQLQQAQQQGDTGKAGEIGAKITYYEAYLSAVTDGLKGWDTISAEFMTRINEANAAIATNAQEQQNVNPSLGNREIPVVGPDGKPTGRTTTQYGQLAQGFDAKAIAAELNDLAYSLKNLGKNIRGFIVGAVDTFVSTVADKLIKGAEKVDTTALNQARADLYQAQGDASYNLAQQRKDLADAEAAANQMPGNAGAQARRADMQAAYAESSRSYGEAVNARQQQVKELEQQQQGQGIGGALQEAFTALSQEFASTMLKTILLSPFQGLLNKLTGKTDGSAANPFHTIVDNLPSGLGGNAKDGGGVLGSEKGGIIDSVLGPLKGIFDGIGSIFGGLVSSVAQIFGNKSMGPGIGSVIGSIIGGIAGFAEGGRVSGPGTGTSDSIPAWLSNGEYVLTKKEVDAIGVQNIEKWKSAMASPAKFATGGLVQTFDSAARNAANYSNAGATGGSTDVTIIDQRSQANSEPVSVSRTRGPDNKEVIQVMVRDAVKNAINSGMMDRTMAANYGARRTGARR